MASQGRKVAKDRPLSRQPRRYHCIDIWPTAGRCPLVITSELRQWHSAVILETQPALQGKIKPTALKECELISSNRDGFIQVQVFHRSHAHQLPHTPSAVLSVPRMPQDWLCWQDLAVRPWRCAGGTGLPRDKKKCCVLCWQAKGMSRAAAPSAGVTMGGTLWHSHWWL